MDPHCKTCKANSFKKKLSGVCFLLGLFELSTLLLNLSYKYPVMKSREVVEFFVSVISQVQCGVEGHLG